MSRPGLSMWGKEGEPMTPQERAAAFVQAWMKQSTYTTESFINDVLEHDKETRRAVLMEAAKLVGDYNCMHDHGKKATKACDDVFDELHRLAQEG